MPKRKAALQCWKDLGANSLALTDIHIDGHTGFSFFLVKRSHYLINIRSFRNIYKP